MLKDYFILKIDLLFIDFILLHGFLFFSFSECFWRFLLLISDLTFRLVTIWSISYVAKKLKCPIKSWLKKKTYKQKVTGRIDLMAKQLNAKPPIRARVRG